MSSPNLPVVLAPEANLDYVDIIHYGIEAWGTEQANSYQAELIETIDRLGEHPRLGRARDDLRPGLRTLPFKQHVIVYRIDPSEVTVLRILHSRMDLARHLEE